MAELFVAPLFDVGAGLTPSDGSKLFFSDTGLSFAANPKATFTTIAGDISHANPVIADANGVFPEIWLKGIYRAVMTDKNDVQKFQVDNINANGLGNNAWVSFAGTPTQTSSTTFTVTGDQTTTFQVGRRVLAEDSSDLYGTITASVFTSLTTVTLKMDSGSLSGSLTAVSHGLLSVTNPEVGSDSISHRDRVITSGILRSQYSRNKDVPHVRDWVPDLKGTNDYTTEFQAAMTECILTDESGSDFGYLKSGQGTIKISAPITTPKVNFKFEGPGMGRLKLDVTGTGFPTTGHRGIIEIPPDAQFFEMEGLNLVCAGIAQYGILTPVDGSPSDDRKHIVLSNMQATQATEVCFALAAWMVTLTQLRGGGNDISKAIFDIGRITIPYAAGSKTSSREGTTTYLTNCYALQAQNYGFRFTDIAGLVLNACAADDNDFNNLTYVARFENCTATLNGCDFENNSRLFDIAGSSTGSHVTCNTVRAINNGLVASTTQLIQMSGGQLDFRNSFIDVGSVGGNVTYAVQVGASGVRVTFDSSSTDLAASTNNLTTTDQLTEVSPVRKARVTMNGTDQVDLVTATETQIEFDVEEYDVGANFDITSSNWDYTIPSTGWYRVSGQIHFIDVADQKQCRAIIKRTGTTIATSYVQTSNPSGERITAPFNYEGHFNKDAVVTIWGYHTHGSNRNVEGDKDATFLQIEKMM